MIKRLALILIFSFVAGCLSIGNTQSNIDRSPSWKAVYLVHGQGELSLQDLQAHPEVAVAQTFDDFKKYAVHKLALWVDKGATPFNSEQEKWINEAPQAYYPLVLVGYSDTLYSFRDLLRLCCFMGPIIEWEIEPGFSIIQRAPPADPTTAPIDVPFMHGYNQQPTVQSILEITNDLLEGRVRPTPISTLPKPPLQIATSATRQIILYDEEPRNGFANDAAKINTIGLGSNILTIDVTYHGNCREHTFELYVWTAFLQSNPPQGVLFLSHDSHGDTCTEDVEQELAFDLTPLNKERADSSAGHLLLRIYEPIGGSFAKEPFGPFEWP